MKDYYRALGVLRNAEEIVIKAAYKALAQKYHPDRLPDHEKESATQKMIEINEAKEVLLNTSKREQYNKEYDKQNIDRQSYGSEFNEQEQFNKGSIKDDDWNTALSYYPDLKKIIKYLGLISTNLANLFKNYMIESRRFEDRHKISEAIENDYLIRFYGDDKNTRIYVKNLLLNNLKHAAIEINKHILIMGNSITYNQIYPKIEKKFPAAKTCRLQIDVHKITILKRVDDPRLDNLISKLENKKIWNTEVIELFEALFETQVDPDGYGDDRSYSYSIGNRKYNKNLDYLKNKIIERLETEKKTIL